MSHVDDGELTAYADGAYAPADADAQRIAAHLALCADCRNRLDETRALTGRAREILAFAEPTAVAAPAFEELSQAAATAPRGRRMLPLSWAASIILALGIGWFGRGAVSDPEQRVLATSRPPADAVDAAVAAEQDLAAQESDAAPAVGATASSARAAPAAAIAPARPRPEPAAASGAADARRLDEAPAVAAEALPQPVPMIPGLEVVRIAQAVGGMKVEQRLPDGVTVTITTAPPTAESTGDQAGQRVAAAAPPAAGQVEAREEAANKSVAAPQALRAAAVNSVAVSVRGQQVRISGPLSEDSLKALAARLR